ATRLPDLARRTIGGGEGAHRPLPHRRADRRGRPLPDRRGVHRDFGARGPGGTKLRRGPEGAAGVRDRRRRNRGRWWLTLNGAGARGAKGAVRDLGAGANGGTVLRATAGPKVDQ